MPRKHQPPNPAQEAFDEGYRLIAANAIFRPMMLRDIHIYRQTNKDPAFRSVRFSANGLAVVYGDGSILCNITKRESPEVWLYVLAHCMLHLGFGHIVSKEKQKEWNAACDCFVARFLHDVKLGRPPGEMVESLYLLPRKTEQALYDSFIQRGIPEELQRLGTGDGPIDMFVGEGEMWNSHHWSRKPPDWPALFAQGLQQAVAGAVSLAAGHGTEKDSPAALSKAQQAKAWFISSYPLLGALATSFIVVEDTQVCDRMHVGIAAVSYVSQEIYINPAAGLSINECRFVIAHELLHVGLRHDLRCGNRDPYLWNLACDFVINGWLYEMEVGDMPRIGGLFDPELRGLSAETIYDRLAVDIRRARKLQTLRNRDGLGDMIDGLSDLTRSAACSLDEAVRRALLEGLDFHQQSGRGYLPADLIEEIRALGQPPIPWDVELAEWFEAQFLPLEKRRTYARLSRRQSATPDIPRPNWTMPIEAMAGRTFGVIIDTSGSMDRQILAKALGAVASYSQAHEVPAARVVFCDAAVYDQGYMPPDEIAGKVKVRGRGGTVLQPAVDFLEAAEDFPKEGPVLVITDGLCDDIRLHREHAFLMPRGARLPFPPKGKVFFME